MREKMPGVFEVKRDVATKSIVPGKKVYDERVARVGKDEYRIWDPKRSKLGAAIMKGLKNMPIRPGMKVLYLGIASGTTASHISDLLGDKGQIYGVEFAPRPTRDLARVAQHRKNILPILGDARIPEEYADRITQVDMIFEDVAQKDMSEILIRNAKVFLKKDGWAMIAIKARSIDVSKKSRDVFAEQKAILSKYFKVIEEVNLHPFEKDHVLFVLRK